MLKSIQADEDQRREMEEILRRIHDADLEEVEALTCSEDESDGEEGALSKATWRRLLEKVCSLFIHGVYFVLRWVQGSEAQSSLLPMLNVTHTPTQLEATGQLDVTEEDLTPNELQEFHAALAGGRLLEDQIVDLWKPWWTDPAAAEVELGPRGCPLIEEGTVICTILRRLG